MCVYICVATPCYDPKIEWALSYTQFRKNVCFEKYLWNVRYNFKVAKIYHKPNPVLCTISLYQISTTYIEMYFFLFGNSMSALFIWHYPSFWQSLLLKETFLLSHITMIIIYYSCAIKHRLHSIGSGMYWYYEWIKLRGKYLIRIWNPINDAKCVTKCITLWNRNIIFLFLK